ncbi:MAG: hypothetical protein RL060_1456 [Bacteroidota bacterium]
MVLRFIYSILVVIIGLLPVSSFAQEGNIYLHNYNSKLDNHHTLSIYQGHNGLMYFINHKGIVSYDGVHWKNLSIHNTPESESVAPGRAGKVYVGCHQNFGFISTDNLGNEKYISLNGKTKVEGDIVKIEFTQRHVYFFSARAIYRVNLENNKFDKYWVSTRDYPFEGITMLNDKIYVQIKKKGIFEFKNEILTYVTGSKEIGTNKVVSSFPFDSRQNLLATDSNKVYLFDGVRLKPFKVESQQYLNTNIVSCGTDLSATEFVLGTLSGGCVIIDKSTGNTKYTVNYQTGLPDDEITALGKDVQGGLWIAHASGVTRADNNLPVKKFSIYPGLEGHITSAISIHDTLYVSTSEGLFYLSKVESLEDIQEYIRDTLYTYKPTMMMEDEPRPRREAQIHSITKTVTIVQDKPETKLDKMLSLFSKKKKKNQPNIQERIDTVKINKPHPQIPKRPVVISLPKKHIAAVKVRVKSSNRRKKEIYAMQSIPYVYKRVNGISGKCRQMIAYKDGMLVSSNVGLFFVKGINSKPLLKGHYVNFVHQSEKNPAKFFVGTGHGLYQALDQDGIWRSEKLYPNINPNINTIAEENDFIWLGAFNQIIKIPYENDQLGEALTLSFHNGYSENIQVREVDGKAVFFFNSGIMKYNYKLQKFVKDAKLQHYFSHNAKFIFTQPGYSWSNSNFKWKTISFNAKNKPANSSFIDLLDKVQDIYTDSHENLWVVNDNALHRVKSSSKLKEKLDDFFIDIRTVKGKDDNHLDLDSVSLDYNNNYIAVEVSAPFYLSENAIEYQYQLEGLHHQGWSKWTRDPLFEFPYLPVGTYVLHLRAKNVFNQISKEKLFYITIKPPFWKTTWFISLVSLFSIFVIYLVIVYRLRALEKANKVLEEKVRVRTQQVLEQKEELVKQKTIIENLYHDVTDSIDYAQKIQAAILPSEQQFKSVLDNAFVFFKPKNVVSGDFYWFAERSDRYIIAAVDCTGHGVPGAFMSMIGNTLLNQIVNERNIVEPAEALNNLHKGIRRLLKQDQADNLQKDGMDIVLISVHKTTHEVQYAGANNSLFYIENDEVKELKADKYSIGGLQKEQERKFTNHTLQITSKTTFFLTSDGFQDQFDEAFENKFSARRMKQLFLDMYHLDAEVQKNKLDTTIANWRGTEEQMDDLMVLGFTINPSV